MRIYKSSGIAACNLLVFVPLALVCIFCFSQNGFSQNAAIRHSPVVTYGDLDTMTTNPITRSSPSATWKQVLANTRLSCHEPNCQVTGFTISFLPMGMDFRGPYTIRGSSELDADIKSRMAELAGNPQCRIFIEKILVKYKDETIELSRPLAFTVTNR